MCEIIDAGLPKHNTASIRKLLDYPKIIDDSENYSTNLSNMKLIVTSLKGKMQIIAGNSLTTFGIAFPIKVNY